MVEGGCSRWWNPSVDRSPAFDSSVDRNPAFDPSVDRSPAFNRVQPIRWISAIGWQHALDELAQPRLRCSSAWQYANAAVQPKRRQPPIWGESRGWRPEEIGDRGPKRKGSSGFFWWELDNSEFGMPPAHEKPQMTLIDADYRPNQ